MSDKPPYKVPTMDEVRAIPWNGLKVASTFSGAGGSCTGYRMAGYRVVWANEFVPAAQESYKANASEHCYLDCRDIKHVHPEEILEKTGLKAGELDLFDGSPPCQAFSTAGKREKGWGKDKSYEHGAKQKNETLFSEYIRLLRGLMPKTFVAENVSGLVKGTAKGYFLEILRDLKASGYRVKCQVLDAQWLGVPQRRQRTVFIGVRNDLNMEPVFPLPFPYLYSLREAIDGLVAPIEPQTQLGEKVSAEWRLTGIGKKSTKYFQLFKCDPDCPSPTITGPAGTGAAMPDEPRRFSVAEMKRVCSFPDDFELIGTFADKWMRLGNSVPPLMMRAVASEIRDRILNKQ